MYSAPYGYPNPAGGPAFNGAPPQQNPHLQPGPSPGQPQQMMYNPQQFPMGGAQGGHFPAAPNPAMMGGAAPAGMMQNTAMPHMGANGQSKLPLFIYLLHPPPSHTPVPPLWSCPADCCLAPLLISFFRCTYAVAVFRACRRWGASTAPRP